MSHQLRSARSWHQNPQTALVSEQHLNPHQQTSQCLCIPLIHTHLFPEALFWILNLLRPENSWVISHVSGQPSLGGVLSPKLLAPGFVWPRAGSSQDSNVPVEDCFSVFKTIKLCWIQPIPNFDGTRAASCWWWQLTYKCFFLHLEKCKIMYEHKLLLLKTILSAFLPHSQLCFPKIFRSHLAVTTEQESLTVVRINFPSSLTAILAVASL